MPGVINHAELSADRELTERLKLVSHPASLIGKRPLTREEDDALRCKVGLGPADELTRHGGRLRAGPLPGLWYPECLREPACRHYRPDEQADRRRIDQWLTDLPSNQPLVLTTLGTGAPDNMPRDAPLFEILVEALGAVRCVAIVAIGRYCDPSE